MGKSCVTWITHTIFCVLLWMHETCATWTRHIHKGCSSIQDVLCTLKLQSADTARDDDRSSFDTWCEPTVVDCLVHLDSCLGKDDSTVVEVSTRISRVRTAYAGLSHLTFRWSWRVVCTGRRCAQLCCIVWRYGICVPKVFVAWRFLVIGIYVVTLEPDGVIALLMCKSIILYWVPVQQIFLHNVRSLVDFRLIFPSSHGMERTTWRSTDDVAPWNEVSNELK